MDRPLLSILDQAYDRRSWHGTSLRGSLRRVSSPQAAWRPAPGRHNIGELVVHCAYWKYAVWRRLAGGARGSFPLQGSNWFARAGDAGEDAWRADVALLDRMHAMLREAAAGLSESELGRVPEGGRVTIFNLLSGVAAHDLYHAGQVQLLKRLWSAALRREGHGLTEETQSIGDNRKGWSG
ncbi:MAG: DinB family protein [bacterium]|nr:DinB family protein [bacterium]